VSVFGPADGPSVHDTAVAMPSLPVATGVAGFTAPPPLVTANVTGIPATRFPSLSSTLTAGAIGTEVPAVAVCPSPATMARLAAREAVALAVNATVRFAGAPFPTARAVAVWVPVPGPRTHCAVARPSASVLGAAGEIVPAPVPGVNSTR
jgi:hypothetical protein